MKKTKGKTKRASMEIETRVSRLDEYAGDCNFIIASKDRIKRELQAAIQDALAKIVHFYSIPLLRCACGKPATQDIRNRFNARYGCYCDKCSKRKLPELNLSQKLAEQAWAKPAETRK